MPFNYKSISAVAKKFQLISRMFRHRNKFAVSRSFSRNELRLIFNDQHIITSPRILIMENKTCIHELAEFIVGSINCQI